MITIDDETFRAMWDGKCRVIFRRKGTEGHIHLIGTPGKAERIEVRITHVQEVMRSTFACSIEVLDRIATEDDLYEWKVYGARDEQGRLLPLGQAF
jgi:hypothetical protein